MDLPSRLRAAWEELWIACFAWIPTPLGLALRWLAWRWLFAGCGSVRFGTGLSFVGCRHMRLGDAVRLGRGCIITAGDGEPVLGDRVSISPYAHVAADGGRIVMGRHVAVGPGTSHRSPRPQRMPGAIVAPGGNARRPRIPGIFPDRQAVCAVSRLRPARLVRFGGGARACPRILPVRRRPRRREQGVCMALKCLVFDCDGVILDSVPVKTRAFARLAEPYGEEARDRFVMYHTVHGGVSRYKKFEWFFREILDREITPAESEEWGRRFAEYALDEVRRCELIPGIARVLEHWQGKLPLYVCSGAPHEELNFILKERGLDSCFTGIYGSPPSKAKLLAMIVDKACVLPDEVLMVGDASTDRNAAEEVGTLFYGTGPDLRGGDFPWGPDLTGLDAWIAEHVE